MRKQSKAGVALVASFALCATLGAGTAFAGATTQVGGDGAQWIIPTTSMTNTVWKDADGNLVAANTEGATQYKVLTTWAEAWSTSGPDYLGISNSAYFGNGGNGNPKVTDANSASKTNTVGVWATAANESPNAYNWNMFYNLYANSAEGIAAGATTSDWTSVSTTTNGGADWDTSSGVWCGFKYRPEVVWTNNNLSADQAKTYISYIKEGKYSATATAGSGRGAVYTPGDTDSSFAVYGDSEYNPAIVSPNNNSPYSFVNSAYELADAAQQVIDATASNTGLAEGEALDWKSVNKLPRSNRYSETVTECATDIEQLAKGSVYYALSKIADGTVSKKKVAYVCYPWNYSSTDRQTGTTTTVTDATQVVVAVYDYTENIGSGPMDGRASWTPLAVDQLSTANKYGEKTGGGSVSTEDQAKGNSTTTYQLYYATADDLASCDVVYCSPNVAKSQTELQQWIETNATSETSKEKAKSLSYLATWPCITNGSNYTMEKLIYGAYGLDFIYPELFPSMELSSYWTSNIYHVADSSLQSAMSWIFASASLPTGVSLSNIPANYNDDAVRAKFAAGLSYFNTNKTTDATIVRVLSNTALDGTTELSGNPYVFGAFEPSDTWNSEPIEEKTQTGIAGENRYQTMNAIATNAFSGTCDYAVIASGEGFADALAASSLAGALDAPTLLVSDDHTAEAVEAMKTLGVKEFYVVGGVNSVSETAVAALVSQSGAEFADRIAGENRQQTAELVAEQTIKTAGASTTAIIATGKNFADSLSISPYAFDTCTPIYLTKDDGTFDDATVAAIKAAGYTNFIIAGGVNSVSDSVAEQLGIEAAAITRLAGDSRYETSVEIAKYTIANDDNFSWHGVTIADGKNYPDALAGTCYAANNGNVLLLTTGDSTAATTLLQSNAENIFHLTYLGGLNSVTQETRDALFAAIQWFTE